MVPLVISASLCGACDRLWNLEHVPDAPAAEACTQPIGHDEEGDGLDDACDPCPFDTNNNGDQDDDGIATTCDPDPGTKNDDVFFSGFDGGTRVGQVPSPLPRDQMHGISRAFYSRAGSPAVGCSFETPQLQPRIDRTPTTQPAPGTIALWAEDIGVSFRFVMITTK